MEQVEEIRNGKAAAAIIAGGIGIAAIGIFSTAAECIPSAGKLLNLFNRGGSLTGIMLFSVLLWGLSWLGLNSVWNNKDVDFGKVIIISRLLLVIGLLGTFPLFFDLFSGG